MRILIVDDESIMLDMLGTMITQVTDKDVQDWKTPDIIKCLRGVEAVKIFNERKVDMVFLDIEMPDLNGLDCLKEMHKAKPDAYIVMVSGAGTIQNVKSALETGASGFIVKPYNVKKLHDILKNFGKPRKSKLPKEN